MTSLLCENLNAVQACISQKKSFKFRLWKLDSPKIKFDKDVTLVDIFQR